MSGSWLHVWEQIIILFFFIQNGFNLFLVGSSFWYTRRYLRHLSTYDETKLFRIPLFIKPVSILAPAYNEQATVAESVRSLLNLHYPQFEIILINDGSKDDTLRVLITNFGLERVERAIPPLIPCKAIRGVYASPSFPNLVVVDKDNGGKADALNAGVNVSRFPLFMAIDSDSLLERGALSRMVRPFLQNPNTVAVGGVVRIVNGCQVEGGDVVQMGLPRNMLGLFQVVEYMRAFLFGRMGWRALNMVLVISGAMGMFKKSAVVEVGGYRTQTVGEDMELIVRMHHHFKRQGVPYQVDFLPDPVCWTEAPETLQVLGRQRKRWHRGLLECFALHKEMTFNPRYGRVGLFAMPFFLIFEIFGPLIQVIGIAIFLVDWQMGNLENLLGITVLVVSILLGIVNSLAALILEELTFGRYPALKMVGLLFVMGILENFGYRQINSWWRIKGTWEYFWGVHQWGEMTRVGFAKTKR